MRGAREAKKPNVHRRLLAFDYDGTLAENGRVPPALQTALERLRAAGHVLFLATGRRLESVALGPLKDLFAGIVWENGAVLYHTRADEIYLPFGDLSPGLAEALAAAGVPLERGQAILSTWKPHEETVRQVLNQWGGDPVVAHNKGAVMILPPGATKGAGLERLLALCGYSPRNLVSFGDGENDLSLLRLGEVGVAVADAVPALKAVADLVTTRPGPAGVLEALETHWLTGTPRGLPSTRQREREIPLGEDESGTPVSIPGSTLAGRNLGVFGDSNSGKSWVTGLLAEGMHFAGYQVFLIDPEGDFRGLRALPGMVAFEGNLRTLPSPALVTSLLEFVTVSVVLDLSAYPVVHRDEYVADLLRGLRALKERKFRPHWIVLEEAQHFLPPSGNALSATLLPMLAGGGWAFISYRPDRLAGPVLEALDHVLLTRLSEPEGVQAVRQKFSIMHESLADIPMGYAWWCSQHLVHLRSNARRVPHIRHLYKYLDTPLPKHKRFHFRDEGGHLGLEAASLFEFLRVLPTLPGECLAYHQARGDFAAWVRGALGDGILAGHLHKLAHRPLEGEALREALLHRVAAHYAELHAQR